MHKSDDFMQVFYLLRKKALSLPRNFYNSFLKSATSIDFLTCIFYSQKWESESIQYNSGVKQLKS